MEKVFTNYCEICSYLTLEEKQNQNYLPTIVKTDLYWKMLNYFKIGCRGCCLFHARHRSRFCSPQSFYRWADIYIKPWKMFPFIIFGCLRNCIMNNLMCCLIFSFFHFFSWVDIFSKQILVLLFTTKHWVIFPRHSKIPNLRRVKEIFL